MTKKQRYFILLGPVVGILLSYMSPPEGLSVEAIKAIAILVCAVIWLIGNVIAEYVVTILMCTFWVLFKVVPFPIAFASFSQSSWWLLIGALGIGVAVAQSGLLKRLSLYIMRVFPATFTGQVLALVVSGLLISPLIPSTTAKSVIVAPISQGISDAMGYQRKSCGAAGLFSAFYIGFSSLGPMFLSASFLGYLILNLYPDFVSRQFSWGFWLTATLPWGIIMLSLTTIGILKFYRPQGEQKLPDNYVSHKLEQLGPWCWQEKLTLVVMVSCLLLWMSETIHGIPSYAVAIVALAVLLLCKVYDRQAFGEKLGWDNIIFIGGVMNVGAVLSALKIERWIGLSLESLITPLISQPYLFVIALVVIIYLVRFIVISHAATLTIFILLLTPFAREVGMNPWIIGMVTYCSLNIWLLFYQNSLFLTSYYATGGEMVEHKQMLPLCFIYMLASLLGLLCSVPYWQWLGLISRH